MANHFFHFQSQGQFEVPSAKLNEQGDGPSLSSRRPAVEVSRLCPLFYPRFHPHSHKNDQAHVEQKNFTHVRLLLGYHRIDQPHLVPAMNALYQSWNAFLNFFCPTLQLASKRRVGTRVVRKYSKPKTPYQRILASPHVSPESKAKLQARLVTLDPLDLKKTIETQLQAILKQLQP